MKTRILQFAPAVPLKRALLVWVGLMAAILPPSQAMNERAVSEVLKLKNAGVGDHGIIAYIKREPTRYRLSANDVLLLKNQGLSTEVLTVMLASPNFQPAVVVVPGPRPPAPAGPVVVPVRPAPTPALGPDAAYFAQQLAPYGKWLLADDNQWYWQPTVAVSAKTWRPYWNDGHWMYTDGGWYWASDYPWGWAAFHYGRWRLHPLHGWVWLPDQVWAPAWVAWRAGGEYCGWAPLPPGATLDTSGALNFRGRPVSVEFDFGLDWHHFNFCRVRELGRSRFGNFRDDDRHRVYTQTTVINNYTVRRMGGGDRVEARVFNGGINPDRVGAARGRRVETVTIRDLRAPAPDRAHEHFDKRSKTLEVYRPHFGPR